MCRDKDGPRPPQSVLVAGLSPLWQRGGRPHDGGRLGTGLYILGRWNRGWREELLVQPVVEVGRTRGNTA